MLDFLTKKERSKRMSLIKSKNTLPEVLLRKEIFKLGYRYGLHRKDLPGHPDIIMRKYNLAIQVRGCHWHRHGCSYMGVPKSNKKFWMDKFKRNVDRDKKNDKGIKKLGWKLCVVWECEIKRKSSFNKTLLKVVKKINEN